MTGLETGHHVYIEAQSAPTKKAACGCSTRRKWPQVATNIQVGDKSGNSTLLPCPKASGAASSGTSSPRRKDRLQLYLDGTEVPGTP